MPALDEIFFIVNRVKIFPFKDICLKKTRKNAEIQRIETKFMNQRETEIKANDKDLIIWLSLQEETLF